MKNISSKVIGLFDRKPRDPARRNSEKEIRKAISELRNLSDRDLDDIGIARYEIEERVRFGHAANNSDYDQNGVA